MKKNLTEQAQKRRKILFKDEERAKRGRWVVIVLFFLSLLFSYYFWTFGR